MVQPGERWWGTSRTFGVGGDGKVWGRHWTEPLPPGPVVPRLAGLVTPSLVRPRAPVGEGQWSKTPQVTKRNERTGGRTGLGPGGSERREEDGRE